MKKPAPTYFFSSVLLLLVAVSPSPAQEKFRRVDQNTKKYSTCPLDLVGCDIGNGVVSNCSQIVGRTDWWKNLTLTLKNVSEKTISEFNIELTVEKQANMRLDSPIVLVPQDRFDRVIDTDGHESFNFRGRVKPGDTFRMTVPDIAFQQMSQRLKTEGVPEVDRMSLNIQFIFFDDGSRWDFGRFTQLKRGQSSDISQKRINELLSGTGNEPIAITGLLANGKPINLNETFIADGEWLKDLTITFKNTSGRTIRWMSLFLVVLESNPAWPPPGMSIDYGTPWTYTKVENQKITALAPGETGSVRIDPALFEKLKRSLAAIEDLSHRTTAEIRLMDVTFSDDTRWSWGKFYKLNQSGGLMLDGDGSGKKPN